MSDLTLTRLTPAVFLAVVIAAAGAGAYGLTFNRDLFSVRPAEEFAPGEVVVLMDEPIISDEFAAAAERAGARVEAVSIANPARAVVKVPVGQEDAYVRAYANAPGVRAIDKNYVYRALWKPNDTYYNLQWHYNKPDFIKAETGWDITRGAKNVIVAVVDTGVAYEDYAVPAGEQSEVSGSSYAKSPDFANTHFVAGYDFVHQDDHPNDQNGHGTHVAGTIAESTDNGRDVAGLAHLCSIMPIQVLDNSGSGYLDGIADGIDWARTHGAHVINMSLGALTSSEVLKAACDDAWNNNVIVVAAAGNDGSTILSYPAAYDSVISVAAVDYAGELTFYSNTGIGLDISAPGGDTSADLNGDGNPDGVLQMTYAQMYESEPTEVLATVGSFNNVGLMGTSMASPHVAALAALIISTGVTNKDDVRSKLLGSATDLGSAGYDTTYGYGLMNCEASLKEGVPDLGTDCGQCGGLGGLGLAMVLAAWGVPFLVTLPRRLKNRNR